MFRKIFFPILTFIFLLTACLPVGQLQVGFLTPTRQPEDTPGVIATQEPSQVPGETATEIASAPTTETEQLLGTVSGNICYPSEFIPAMTAYFLEVNTGQYTELAISENLSNYLSTYQVKLPAGMYQAFAWRGEYGLGGGYTPAVPCGFAESCTDHSLLTFEVKAGEMISDINICDWVMTNLPLPPGATQPISQGTSTELAGLVYVSDGLYRVRADGQSELLFGRSESILSPDGAQAVYWLDDDLWLIDLASGESRNLTNTPDRVEYLPREWKTRNDILLFTSYPVGVEVGPGITGFLTMVRTDGTGYLVLDDLNQAINFDLSPDGQTIAYGAGPMTYLYRWTTGREVFDPADYGLSQIGGISSPSWSPDGKQIAWLVSGVIDGIDQSAIAFFNLEARTATLNHRHQLPGMDGIPAAGRWSTDSKWYAVYIFDMDFTRAGTWVLQADGMQETSIYMGYGASAMWSPDGKSLAVTDPDSGGVRLVDVMTWESRLVDLSLFYLVAWIAP